MKQNKAAFLKELSFQEKRTLTISFLEFTLKSYQFEFDNDPSELTTEQMEPIFAELRGQISKVKAMSDSPQNGKNLSETIKDMLTILKHGQKEGTCRRLNYSLKLALPDALRRKVYDFVGIDPENLILDNAL